MTDSNKTSAYPNAHWQTLAELMAESGLSQEEAEPIWREAHRLPSIEELAREKKQSTDDGNHPSLVDLHAGSRQRFLATMLNSMWNFGAKGTNVDFDFAAKVILVEMDAET